MSGLILKLRPFEQLLINGVVVENGERNTRLRVKTEGAHILRMKNAMRPEDAKTPLKRAYYVAQLAVAGQLPNADAAAMLNKAIENLVDEKTSAELRDRIEQNDFYHAMRYLGALAFSEADDASLITVGAEPSRDDKARSSSKK